MEKYSGRYAADLFPVRRDRPESIGGRELERAGFKVREVRIRLEQPARRRWFEVVTQGGEEALMLRQRSNIWHAFFPYQGTASGTDPNSALKGGLGDAISTDMEMKEYCGMVLRASRHLVEKYDGLYAAQTQCHNESR